MLMKRRLETLDGLKTDKRKTKGINKPQQENREEQVSSRHFASSKIIKRLSFCSPSPRQTQPQIDLSLGKQKEIEYVMEDKSEDEEVPKDGFFPKLEMLQEGRVGQKY